MEILLEYLAKGFMIMLAISMPCVLVAAGIGLVVGILQAVTQVQEQTIAAAPKLSEYFGNCNWWCRFYQITDKSFPRRNGFGFQYCSSQ